MDQVGFEELYRRLSTPFFKVAASRVGPGAAQDVVHEVFEVVWSKRNQAPAEPETWGPWAWGILRNKILQESQRRVRKHHDARFAADYQQDVRAAAPLADVAEEVTESHAARAVWSTLSEDDRSLLLLVTQTDLPGAEVANLMGISHDAYRRRVSRMRARIAASATSVSQLTPGGEA